MFAIHEAAGGHAPSIHITFAIRSERVRNTVYVIRNTDKRKRPGRHGPFSVVGGRKLRLGRLGLVDVVGMLVVVVVGDLSPHLVHVEAIDLLDEIGQGLFR